MSLLEQLTCKEKRLTRKFCIDSTEEILLDRNTGLPYLCYEDIFDAIYETHMNSDITEMRILFTQLKRKYANISFECVLEYFKVRSEMNKQLLPLSINNRQSKLKE
uniref:Late expression factor 11 n=1 Tax=Meloidogyne hapla TaxID=6305 RepID=A0A1I8BD92_MELHA